MFYVIQKNTFRQVNYDSLVNALERLELEYEVIDCLPFTEEVDCITERKDVFVFGSVKLATLATKKNWKPGSFYGNNHDYLIYGKYYKDNLLNCDSEIYQLTDKLDWYPYEVKFIRPTKDTKIFNGGLFTKTKWEDELLYATSALNEYNKEDNFIQVAKPKRIYKEARLWIINGKIITSSYYLFNGLAQYEEDIEPEGLEFAKLMVNFYQPAEAFVMDVCFTPDGWKIIELNCINCSGFYKGDIQKLLIALEQHFTNK